MDKAVVDSNTRLSSIEELPERDLPRRKVDTNLPIAALAGKTFSGECNIYALIDVARVLAAELQRHWRQVFRSCFVNDL